MIRDISIAVGPAEIVAVIGPNGAGKSTLLKSLVGILRVTAGRVLLGEDEVTNHPRTSWPAAELVTCPR